MTHIDDRINETEIGQGGSGSGQNRSVAYFRGQRLTRDEIRRALVLKEVLDQPQSLQPVRLDVPGEREGF